MGISRDYTGMKRGMMTAVREVGSNGRRKLWLVRCECGAEKTLVGTSFATGDAQSCNSSECRKELRRRKGHKPFTTHGMSKHPAYAVWRSMLDRCRLPTHQAWHNYGGRGIRVCVRWEESFENFWADMGPTYQRGLTLERVDNDAGYGPSNCRWADWKSQSRNQRRNAVIDTPEGPMLVCEAAEKSGIGMTTLLYRKGVGVPAERMFDPPDFTNRFTTF